MSLDRRRLLTASAGVAMAGASAVSASAQAAPAACTPVAPSVESGAVTETLARYVVAARFDDLPEPVREQGRRTLLNWIGCAIGGSQHETVDRAVRALGPFSGLPEAGVLGRRERFDVLTAAFLNAVASHIFDYDDTHLKTIIHPAGPVAPAILALSQRRKVTGAEFLHALILGAEVECRIGNAVYPEHYALGWHITGTCGPFGAAAACGKILGLDAGQMQMALGIAASMPVGLKVQFGSMTKSLHPGRAAQNGLLAALLAQQGFTADPTAIEGKDGWGQALSTRHDWREVTSGLGSRYEAALNTYKPFACGIVCHPAIDAAIQLRNENHLTPDQIAGVELHANPLVLSLTGKTDPLIGLEGKFSIYHCIAAGLIDGAAGEKQFSDLKVRDPVFVALRHKVQVRTDPAVAAEKCDLTLRLTDGRTLTRHIEHAIGSLEKPMTNAMLEVKFKDLTDGVIPAAQVDKTIALCRGIDKAPDAGQLAVEAAG